MTAPSGIVHTERHCARAEPSGPPEPAQCNKRHATPAMQSEDLCCQVPRLPRRPRRQTEPKRATGASPVRQVPRLPRRMRVHDKLCELYVDKLCVNKLCGDKLCGDKLCGDE